MYFIKTWVYSDCHDSPFTHLLHEKFVVVVVDFTFLTCFRITYFTFKILVFFYIIKILFIVVFILMFHLFTNIYMLMFQFHLVFCYSQSTLLSKRLRKASNIWLFWSSIRPEWCAAWFHILEYCGSISLILYSPLLSFLTTLYKPKNLVCNLSPSLNSVHSMAATRSFMLYFLIKVSFYQITIIFSPVFLLYFSFSFFINSIFLELQFFFIFF